MIKATIQNSPYCTEMVLPCTETELSKKLGELGMNPKHLAPMAMVIGIEPSELSALEDCEVSLDALNYLGKRMDGMCKAERRQFLAVLSCDEAEIGYGLKDIINLTYNLARYTLIEKQTCCNSIKSSNAPPPHNRPEPHTSGGAYQIKIYGGIRNVYLN